IIKVYVQTTVKLTYAQSRSLQMMNCLNRLMRRVYMSRNWTPQQLDAINARGNSIIVSAAAGSGKTSVLVERVLRLLTDADNPVPENRIIVVTYTDAAANEMRQRLIEEMGKLIEKEPNNALLHEQSMLLTNAHICTIH